MKKLAIISCFLVAPFFVQAQEEETGNGLIEQQLENMAAAQESETEDDYWLQQLERYKKYKVNVNRVGADELRELMLLTELQVQSLIRYRTLFGHFIDLYELQAVPGWDVYTLQRISPYITVNSNDGMISRLRERWKGGDHSFLYRQARVPEKAMGFKQPLQPGANYYPGSTDKMLFRYKYTYRNLLQWGILGDKDAGEPFFRGRQKLGFDFYSFHFFARQLGAIKVIAIGDYSVSLGQGLIQWQSLAFTKSADVMAIKRQSPVLTPYNSSGEYNFHRGGGITLVKNNCEATLFASSRQVDGRIVSDSLYPGGVISSLPTGGYHRTPSENDNRNSLNQLSAGSNIQYGAGNWHAGINVMYHQFSRPLKKAEEPYHLFALSGNSLFNTSVDYSYTWRNLHVFGEAAADRHFNKAFLNGVLISLDERADASILFRKIDREYQSLNGNAFTESGSPVNETGLYTGITLRPAKQLSIAGYADVYRFPWLKFRGDAPSAGRDFLVQLTWKPDKKTELYTRYKQDAKQISQAGGSGHMPVVEMSTRKSMRLQASMQVSSKVRFRSRVEVLWYTKHRRQR
jgi:hypothetical protein